MPPINSFFLFSCGEQGAGGEGGGAWQGAWQGARGEGLVDVLLLHSSDGFVILVVTSLNRFVIVAVCVYFDDHGLFDDYGVLTVIHFLFRSLRSFDGYLYFFDGYALSTVTLFRRLHSVDGYTLSTVALFRRLVTDGYFFFDGCGQVWHNYGFDRHVMFNAPDQRKEQRIDCRGFGEGQKRLR